MTHDNNTTLIAVYDDGDFELYVISPYAQCSSEQNSLIKGSERAPASSSCSRSASDAGSSWFSRQRKLFVGSAWSDHRRSSRRPRTLRSLSGRMRLRCALNLALALLVAERLDRIEMRGFARRIVAKEDADRGRKQEAAKDG